MKLRILQVENGDSFFCRSECQIKLKFKWFQFLSFHFDEMILINHQLLAVCSNRHLSPQTALLWVHAYTMCAIRKYPTTLQCSFNTIRATWCRNSLLYFKLCEWVFIMPLWWLLHILKFDIFLMNPTWYTHTCLLNCQFSNFHRSYIAVSKNHRNEGVYSCSTSWSSIAFVSFVLFHFNEFSWSAWHLSTWIPSLRKTKKNINVIDAITDKR